jgi:pyruvate formate-lyase activating enzyme-like uncharacterized protein
MGYELCGGTVGTMANREPNVKENIAWINSGLKRLTEKEAKSANKERDDLLKSLGNRVRYSFNQSKIHIGELSPGCSICGNGHWSCMYINGLCTAHCFYCPQDRTITQEPRPTADIEFDDPNDYVAYLEKFNVKGVGFSGGEPLLVFGKLLSFIEKIRERFGRSFYLWIYTNGHLVTKDKLIQLKKSGLDEVRFNISANDYDLRAVKLAVDMMATVTVEIPSIPEDHERLKKCLAEMHKIGVKHLNLHQLRTTEYNYKDYVKRGYTFLHTHDACVLESEIAALKLIRYALDKKIGLPINYCSSVYKGRFQDKARKQRYGSLVKEDFEDFTESKFIRRLSVRDSFIKLNKIIKTFIEHGERPELWSLDQEKTEVSFHKSLLKYIDFGKHKLIITYLTLQLRADAGDDSGYEITLSSGKAVFIKKELMIQWELSSPIIIEFIRKMLTENMAWDESRSYFLKNYAFNSKEQLNKLMGESECLRFLRTWESQGVGFPELS